MDFQHLTVDDGLSSGLVYDIAQDSVGFMWFATGNGLNRFSGNSFTHFPIYRVDNEIPQVGVEWINTVVTLNNRVFAGSRNGELLLYNCFSDRLEILAEWSELDILRIINLDSNVLLVGTNEGVKYYNLTTHEHGWVKKDLMLVRDFVRVSESLLLVGTKNGLFSMSLRKESFGKILTKWIEHVEILCLYEDANNNIWIGTESDGLYVINKTGEVLYHKVYYKSANVPSAIRVIKSGNPKVVSLGMDDIGILEISLSFQECDIISRDPNNPNSLSLNSFRDILFDSNNRMWVATTGGGVNLYDPNLKPFTVIQKKPNDNNSLVDNMIRSVFEDSDGDIWIGTENGLSRWNVNEDNWITYDVSNKLNNNAVLSLTENFDYIIAGTYGGGLNFISKKNGHSFTYNTKNGKLAGTDYVFSVIVDKNNQIWYGGHNGPLGVIAPNGHNMTIPIEDVRIIRELSEGSLLIGSLSGIYKVDPVSKLFELVHSFEEGINSLSNNFVFAIAEDVKRNCLWIGTEGGGLNRYDYESGIYQRIRSREPLPSEIIYGIIIDKGGDLWLGTSMGVVRYTPEKNIHRIFQRNDGLPASECNFGAYAITQNGKVFFGTTNGVVSFFPDEIFDFVEQPNIYIKDFSVNGEDFLIPPGQFNVNLLNTIRLSHNQNSLNFYFEAIEFTNFGKSKYQWFLEGFDEEWSAISEHAFVAYNNLKPGKYILHYIASNCDGIWMTKPKTFQIIITPTFWKTHFAYVLYVFMILMLIYVLSFIVHLRNQEKASVSKIKFFVDLAHDIRTPLSLIKLSSDKLIAEGKVLSDEILSDLDLISKNTDRLNRFVTQLLDFQRYQKGKPILRIEKVNFHSFMSEIVYGFKPIIEEKNLGISVEIDPDLEICFDKLKFEKVINNLISNSVKYTRMGGNISIRTQERSSTVSIHIKDDGIGIPISEQNNIFKRFYRAKNAENNKEVGSGIGLILSKRIIEEHKGEIDFISSEGKGTEFYIKLPKKLECTEEKPTIRSAIVRESDFLNVIEKEDDKTVDLTVQIMIVEDNDELRSLLVSFFSSFYRVRAASNGKEAYMDILDNMPDIIISDVMMPEMNGYELCFRLKNDIKTSHIPIVLITALSASAHKVEGIETGADAYIEKPIELSLLRATVANLIKSRRLFTGGIQHNFNNEDESSFSVSDNEFVSRAIAIINDNVDDEQFTVEDLCSQLGVSRSVLFRKIKAVLNISPSELMLKTKLNHATNLLSSTNYSIGEVASLCGFSNSKYFSTVFKKIFGKSPKEYQQDNRKRGKS